MEHLSNDHEDHPNQQKDSHNHKQCLETGLPVVNMMESRWKLMQEHDQDFSMEGNRCRTKTRVRRKKEIQKIRTVRITVWDARGKLTI